MARFDEDGALYGAVVKNAREEVRLIRVSWHDMVLFDLRVFAKNSDGIWVPTRKGLRVRAEVMEQLSRLLGSVELE